LDTGDGKILREEVIINGEEKLTRSTNGGEIFAEEENKTVRFRPPADELTVVARRDSLQHSFLEPLHEWAAGVRHYNFGSSLGHGHFGYLTNEEREVDDLDDKQVVGIFHKAWSEYGKEFVDAVRRDMAAINYPLDDIELRTPCDIQMVQNGIPMPLKGLSVREAGSKGFFDQHALSQGMFRALSILIQVNYSQLAKRAHCILIDDIGEGLDFERSTRLIEILRRKARHASFQLVMTTNDQFVMNHVPLEEWSVLQRADNFVRIRNYQNSKEAFDSFKFVGMSNFTFFEMDYLSGQSAEEAVAAHE
jgi:hypothetical protein